MHAQPHLNLAADDVFYFGNAIGETGNSPTDTAVDTADELRARGHATTPGNASITNAYDFNRDKQVDIQDQLIARANRSGLSPLQLITLPSAASATAVMVTEPAAASLITSTIEPPDASAASRVSAPFGSTMTSVSSRYLSPRPALVDAAVRALYASPASADVMHLLNISTRQQNEHMILDRRMRSEPEFVNSWPLRGDAAADGIDKKALGQSFGRMLQRTILFRPSRPDV
jgi:hypothetical protein